MWPCWRVWSKNIIAVPRNVLSKRSGCQMSRPKSLSLDLIAACAALVTGGTASAQTPLAPRPLPHEIAAPKDTPYPGTIRLAVDATDVTRHIFRVQETIPVTGGPLT